MALLAVVLAFVAVLVMLAVAAVVYTRHLEKNLDDRVKALGESVKNVSESTAAKIDQQRAEGGVTRDEVNRVFAEMQYSNQKDMNEFRKSVAALTPARGGGGGGGGSGGGTDTRSIKDDLERYNTNLSNKIVDQERTLKAIRNSVDSYATSIVQQEQLINAMRRTNLQQSGTQQDMLSAIRGIQDVNVQQEAAIGRLFGVQQEAPRQVQSDDLAKRANLLAIAYYNALRDKTPGQQFADRLLKHMYICGFTDQLYKEQKLLSETYFTIVDSMPYQKRSRCIDVVSYLIEYMSRYIPYNSNPRGLRLYELEIEKYGGSLPSLSKTYGALDAQAPFYPPDVPDPLVGIDRGPQAMYAVKTSSADAQRLLDEAIVASAVS